MASTARGSSIYGNQVAARASIENLRRMECLNQDMVRGSSARKFCTALLYIGCSAATGLPLCRNDCSPFAHQWAVQDFECRCGYHGMLLALIINRYKSQSWLKRSAIFCTAAYFSRHVGGRYQGRVVGRIYHRLAEFITISLSRVAYCSMCSRSLFR